MTIPPTHGSTPLPSDPESTPDSLRPEPEPEASAPEPSTPPVPEPPPVTPPVPVLAPPTAPRTPTVPMPTGAPVSYLSPRPPSPDASSYYPQQPYHAPGWVAPAAATAPPRTSHRTVWLALSIGLVIVVVITGAAIGVPYWLKTRTLGDITGSTTATSRQVLAGNCIADLPADGPVSEVTLVPCSQKHEAEVLSVIGVSSDTWPGQGSIDRRLRAACEMDNAEIEAGFQAVVWAPSQASWGQGDRSGVCIAWLEDGAVTGSFTNGDVKTD